MTKTLESRLGQGLGEDISNVVVQWDSDERKGAIVNMLMDEMIASVNMLQTLMKLHH